MKIFGFVNDESEETLLEQVTLEVDASTLRELAKFLLTCADEMDDDPDWSHEHFCDFIGETLEHDLVVYSAKSAEK